MTHAFHPSFATEPLEADFDTDTDTMSVAAVEQPDSSSQESNESVPCSMDAECIVLANLILLCYSTVVELACSFVLGAHLPAAFHSLAAPCRFATSFSSHLLSTNCDVNLHH